MSASVGTVWSHSPWHWKRKLEKVLVLQLLCMPRNKHDVSLVCTLLFSARQDSMSTFYAASHNNRKNILRKRYALFHLEATFAEVNSVEEK